MDKLFYSPTAGRFVVVPASAIIPHEIAPFKVAECKNPERLFEFARVMHLHGHLTGNELTLPYLRTAWTSYNRPVHLYIDTPKNDDSNPDAIESLEFMNFK